MGRFQERLERGIGQYFNWQVFSVDMEDEMNNEYANQKDYLTNLLLGKSETTWRQARIMAIKLCRLARTMAAINQMSIYAAIQSLASALTGPPKPYKPKTFELWFLERETKRMKYCI
jgi:hypothetical protein